MSLLEKIDALLKRGERAATPEYYANLERLNEGISKSFRGLGGLLKEVGMAILATTTTGQLLNEGRDDEEAEPRRGGNVRQAAKDQAARLRLRRTMFTLDETRYRLARKEIYRVSTFEGFRDAPPTSLEIAIGYVAFFLWTLKGIEFKDSLYAEMANETARTAAIEFINLLSHNPLIVSEIQKSVHDFQPEQEVALGFAKVPRTNPQWGPCLTRAAIMVCRSLAYEATGLMGGHLDFPQDLTVRDFGLIGYLLIAEALDENIAKMVMTPFGL